MLFGVRGDNKRIVLLLNARHNRSFWTPEKFVVGYYGLRSSSWNRLAEIEGDSMQTKTFEIAPSRYPFFHNAFISHQPVSCAEGSGIVNSIVFSVKDGGRFTVNLSDPPPDSERIPPNTTPADLEIMLEQLKRESVVLVEDRPE